MKVAHPSDASAFLIVPSKVVGLPHATLGRDSKLAALFLAKQAAEDLISAIQDDIYELSSTPS